ncbi:Retrovirus-related Pol polyprotein from transposon 17.6, partial [Mucuna pruriens]
MVVHTALEASLLIKESETESSPAPSRPSKIVSSPTLLRSSQRLAETMSNLSLPRLDQINLCQVQVSILHLTSARDFDARTRGNKLNIDAMMYQPWSPRYPKGERAWSYERFQPELTHGLPKFHNFASNTQHFDIRGSIASRGMNGIVVTNNPRLERNIDGCVADGHEPHTVPTKGEFIRELDQTDAHKQHGIPRGYVYHTTRSTRFAKTNCRINRHRIPITFQEIWTSFSNHPSPKEETMSDTTMKSGKELQQQQLVKVQYGFFELLDLESSDVTKYANCVEISKDVNVDAVTIDVPNYADSMSAATKSTEMVEVVEFVDDAFSSTEMTKVSTSVVDVPDPIEMVKTANSIDDVFDYVEMVEVSDCVKTVSDLAEVAEDERNKKRYGITLDKRSQISVGVITRDIARVDKSKSVLAQKKRLSPEGAALAKQVPSLPSLALEPIYYDENSIITCLDNLSKVLRRCIKSNLVLNFEKCHFMVIEGIVLGYLVLARGIEVDKAKVDGFIGDSSRISAKFPYFFQAVIEGHGLCFNQSCEQKKRLTSVPILQALNWELPFELMCDASNFALGAVLGQRVGKQPHVIAYASRTMDLTQVNYTTIEKESLAIMFALKKFRSYLLDSKVIVFSDHTMLKYLLKKLDAKPRLVRWMLLLQQFNVEIKDKKGVENVVADHLSRLEKEVDLIPIRDEFPNVCRYLQLLRCIHVSMRSI